MNNNNIALQKEEGKIPKTNNNNNITLQKEGGKTTIYRVSNNFDCHRRQHETSPDTQQPQLPFPGEYQGGGKPHLPFPRGGGSGGGRRGHSYLSFFLL